MKKDDKLNLLNEKGEIIGEEFRSVIHQKGLLHGEVHVWLITPENEVIYQKRAADQETYPGLLDATAGGHIDLGESAEVSAYRELEEETGVVVEKGDLVFIDTKIGKPGYDEVTGLTNYAIKYTYAYLYDGSIENLVAAEGDGFEKFSLDQLKNLSDKDKKRFIQRLISPEWIELFELAIKKLHENKV
jgi:isopentenyl-diphosphate delta-isomerase